MLIQLSALLSRRPATLLAIAAKSSVRNTAWLARADATRTRSDNFPSNTFGFRKPGWETSPAFVLLGDYVSSSPTVVGGSEMAQLMRSFAWEKPSLGPLQSWPDPLIQSVNLILLTRFPAAVFSGPELIVFYNDAFLPLLGERHPSGLQCVADVSSNR